MTEPTIITNWRTMLLESATLAAQIVTGRLYYPKAPVATDDATSAATKPFGVLAETPGGRKAFLEAGVMGLPYGTVMLTVHADWDIGTMEKFIRDVEAELWTVIDGLPIRDIRHDLSSEPTPGAMAANQTVTTARETTATLTMDYGLNA
jgi:hypothetical protein